MSAASCKQRSHGHGHDCASTTARKCMCKPCETAQLAYVAMLPELTRKPPPSRDLMVSHLLQVCPCRGGSMPAATCCQHTS